MLNLLQELTNCHDQMLQQWESIHDEASLKAATPTILKLSKQEKKLSAELAALKVSDGANFLLSDKEKQNLVEKVNKLKERNKESQRRFCNEIKRVAFIPGGKDLIQQMVEARGDKTSKHEKSDQPMVPAGKMASSIPSLEALDQQSVAALQKLCNVLKVVKNESDALETVRQIFPIAVELKENVNYFIEHHHKGTCADNAQQAADTMEQMNRIGKELQVEFARIQGLQCDMPIHQSLQDLQMVLRKSEEVARDNFAWKRNTPLSPLDEHLFQYGYMLSHYSGTGQWEPPPTSWDDLETLMTQQNKMQNVTRLTEKLQAIRNCRQNGYVVRWGTRMVDEKDKHHVLAYIQETPVTGGSVHFVNYMDKAITSAAGVRVMLLHTIMEEGFGKANNPLSSAPSHYGTDSPMASTSMQGENKNGSGGFHESPHTDASNGQSHPGSPKPPFHPRPSATPGFAGGMSPGFSDSEVIGPLVPESGSGRKNAAGTSPFGSPENFPVKTPEQWEKDLDSTDSIKVYQAMYGLNRVDGSKVSSDLAKRVARKAKELAFDSSQHTEIRAEATKGLVVWGGKYSVPFLVELLDEFQADIQDEALKGLRGFKSPAGAEAAAKILATDHLDRRRAAVEYLESVGPDAEQYVLDYVRPTSVDLTQTTVRLLGKIGTKKSFKAFKMLEKTLFYPLIRSDVEKAKRAIRMRENQQKSQ